MNENLDRQNFENKTFDTLPSDVVCSNFKKCTFNAATRFDRCNLIGCTFNKESEFHLCNVMDEEPSHDIPEHEAVAE